ncbi:hypothetical protein B566_EDAN007290 [Ephemera danica]|nr:hypothetical protein B566_EDAN007290 [Ephemera danica]
MYKSQPLFVEIWPIMRPTVLKLLRQEAVCQNENLDLFYNVYSVCLWDEEGPNKVCDALQEEIMDFICHAQKRVLDHQEDQALLKSYIGELQYSMYKSQPLFVETWPIMRPTVLKLLRQEAVCQNENLDLFYNVYSVCLWDEEGPNKVCDALQEEIMDFICHAQKRVLDHQEDQALLKSYIGEWRKFFEQCDCLSPPFKQLETSLSDKTKPSKKHGKDTIVRKLMLDSWYQSIFCNIKERLQNSAMKLVHAERNGEACDSQLVIGVRESYVNLCSNPDDKLQIYKENFEKAYLDAMADFYKVKAPDYLEANGVHAYMKYADLKLGEEEARAQKYLVSTRSVDLCCLNKLVSACKSTILEECPGMIKANETEGLQLMFKLMDRLPDGVAPMLLHLEKHLITAGLADMVASAELVTQDTEKYVERLRELYHRFSALVRQAFTNDDPRFLTVRDKAYKHVVNDTHVFRLELPTKQSTNLFWQLLVLKYVQNKDVFMRYHKAHLTRRLILDTSADSEKDENMVGWLREVGMPADFVNKLARMFQDIKVSEDLNSQFKDQYLEQADFDNKLARMLQDIKVSEDLNSQFKDQYLETRGSIADSINIKVLNAGAWARGSERVTVSLPLELEDYIPKVEDFYKKKHSGRKLQWYHHMSNGTITFNNAVGHFDLDVTTFQMAVLFAWNQRPLDHITYENLRLATELPDLELRRTLWLRIFRVQEAIIKILKMRKRISNDQLQTELVDILKNMFLPSKKMIEEQVEWLIEHKSLFRLPVICLIEGV